MRNNGALTREWKVPLPLGSPKNHKFFGVLAVESGAETSAPQTSVSENQKNIHKPRERAEGLQMCLKSIVHKKKSPIPSFERGEDGRDERSANECGRRVLLVRNCLRVKL